jgi:hypothetical protein
MRDNENIVCGEDDENQIVMYGDEKRNNSIGPMAIMEGRVASVARRITVHRYFQIQMVLSVTIVHGPQIEYRPYEYDDVYDETSDASTPPPITRVVYLKSATS